MDKPYGIPDMPSASGYVNVLKKFLAGLNHCRISQGTRRGLSKVTGLFTFALAAHNLVSMRNLGVAASP